MPALALLLQRHLWVSSRKLAEKHLVQAKQLLASQDPPDIHAALGLLDATLKLFPQWEKAIELKARALLSLRRFRDIANLLQESIPSLRTHPAVLQNAAEDKITLLSSCPHPPTSGKRLTRKKISFAQCFSLFSFQRRGSWVRCSSKGDKEQWKYTVLGVACCHLGMMEDAMILLSKGKRAASAAHRKQSSQFNEDCFLADSTQSTGDTDLVNQLLGNIKLLVRRRTTALAALDAGLYIEAARHFSKIIDGRRGTPQGFIAECYMYRAVAYHSANRIVDALADCNRSIALNPLCAEALSTRANLYETIGCLADSLQDLEKLKGLYETICRNNMQWVQGQNSPGADLQGCIDFISGRIGSISQRGAGHGSMMDHFGILGVSRGCSRQEVERAYLILSLKHRPDRAAHFVDRCDFVDERDIEAVKDEARVLGMKVFKLLQKAYTWIMSLILEEEMSRVRHIQEGDNMASEEHSLEGALPASWKGMHLAQHVMYDPCFFGISEAAQSLLVEDDASGVSAADVWLTQQEGDQIESPSRTAYTHDMLQLKELEDFSDVDPFDDVGHLVDATLFAHISTCRESANVGTILSQGLPSEAWMCANDWNHQGHSTHALSVT